jgi:hypothetical protein
MVYSNLDGIRPSVQLGPEDPEAHWVEHRTFPVRTLATFGSFQTRGQAKHELANLT